MRSTSCSIKVWCRLVNLAIESFSIKILVDDEHAPIIFSKSQFLSYDASSSVTLFAKKENKQLKYSSIVRSTLLSIRDTRGDLAYIFSHYTSTSRQERVHKAKGLYLPPFRIWTLVALMLQESNPYPNAMVGFEGLHSNVPVMMTLAWAEWGSEPR